MQHRKDVGEGVRVEHGGVGGEMVQRGDGDTPYALSRDTPFRPGLDEGVKPVVCCGKAIRHVQINPAEPLTDLWDERNGLERFSGSFLDSVQVGEPLRGGTECACECLVKIM